MPDTRPALRAAAMAEAFGALAGLRGAAEVADLLRRIERFDEITARKALNDLRKAGLANHDEEDRWTATAAGGAGCSSGKRHTRSNPPDRNDSHLPSGLGVTDPV